MRVLVLTPEAFGGYGGIAKYNRDFITALSEADCIHEIVVLARHISFPIHKESLPEKVFYRDGASKGKVKFICSLLKLLMQDRQFDWVICGHINLISFGYFAAKVTRAPLGLLVYGIDVWHPTASILKDFLVKKINHFISISHFTRDKFLSWLGDKENYSLPNAVDFQEFFPALRNEHLVSLYHLENKKVLMTLARLDAKERYKGIDEVLEVLPQLVLEHQNLVYFIAGDGSDRARLERKTKDLGLENRVIFSGYVPDDQKADFYRLADVFVMPGRGEGFGYVYLEAMASGVPVIGSVLDGSQEALRQGQLGLLVHPDDPKDLKQAILLSLQKPIGVVPAGADYFSYKNFRERLFGIIKQVFKREKY